MCDELPARDAAARTARPAPPASGTPPDPRLRRRFLRQALLGGLGLLFSGPAKAALRDRSTWQRTLRLHRVRTAETLAVVYRTQAGYRAPALAQVSRLLRDTRTGQVKPIDPRLLDFLYAIQELLPDPPPFHVTSGYRSRRTNALLRRQGRGAVSGSFHVKGQAVDISMPGVDIQSLHRAAVAVQAGGVGYYPGRHYLHLDVGPLRRWSGRPARGPAPAARE